MQEKKKSNNFWLILLFIIGLSLLLYPTVANYVNELHGSKAISDYSKSVMSLDAQQYEEMIRDARKYNRSLSRRSNVFVMDDKEKLAYASLLDLGGNGIMGYIEIPAISVMLPVYHGTDDNVLQVAVGHLEWSALPVGGESTHCVLSGHRGLPSAKLFTNLDKLIEGDVFMLRVLDEVMTYQVDQILTVLPEETAPLLIVDGEDYCTLVTCTPYGINSHRLLVRGHRIENPKEAQSVHVTAEALQIEPLIVVSVVGIPLLILIVLGVFIHSGKKEKGAKRGRNNI